MKPTNENLEKFATKALARWLISAANERRDLTYGEAMHKLETEEGFTSIGRATKLGWPVGVMMDMFLRKFPSAPLLNTLLVRQDTRLPGAGAGGYLADYFDVKMLGKDGAIDKHPKLWKEYCEEAMEDVYGFDDWVHLYQIVFDEKFKPDRIVLERQSGNDGKEKDGLPRGRSGEGPAHKALRLWVRDNPAKILPRLKSVRSKTEVELLSGDRVDNVYYADSATVAIEVKSAKSNWYDLQRGVYQCVKYRAILKAMDPRDDADIKALLITETPLDGTLKALIKDFDLKHKIVSPERKTIK